MAWLVAVLLVLGSVGVLLGSRVLGSFGTRVLGAVLFAGGIGVVLTYFQTYWLPSTWTTPMLAASAVVSVLGLAAVLSGGWHGFTLGGLSGTCGLLALGFTAAQNANVPGVGSYERDQFTLAALALAFLAVAAALGATGHGRAAWLRPAGSVVALAGVVVTAISGYDSYPAYAGSREKATVVIGTVVGAVSLVVLATFLVGRRSAGPPVPPISSEQPAASAPAPPVPAAGPDPAPHTPPPVPPTAPQPPPQARPPVTPAAATATIGSSVAVAGPGWRSRLEIAATVVGLITGIIVLVRELLGLLRSLGA